MFSLWILIPWFARHKGEYHVFATRVGNDQRRTELLTGEVREREMHQHDVTPSQSGTRDHTGAPSSGE